jgi:pyruvate ferredoxin oxidoreductase gamma subunit
MLEIRWHGRGGQGAVTASKVLAATALRDGKHFQAFPEYGPERRGAPVQAFTRISDEPIKLFSQVTNPKIVIIVDNSLIGKAPLTDGLPEDGIILANFDGKPSDLRAKLGLDANPKLKGCKVYTVGATAIANRCLGRPITNTPMLGALVKITNVVPLNQLEAEVEAMFGKMKGDLVERNLAAVRAGFEEVVSE